MMNSRNIRLKKIVKMSRVKKGDKVLDLGCKDNELKKFLPEVDYIGVDIDGKPDIKYNLEMGLPKEILNKKFDVIIMGEFLEHIENFKTLLLQCKKCLKENGRIIVSTPFPYRFQISGDPTHIHFFTKMSMRNLAKICGLKITKMKGSFIYIPIFKVIIPSDQIIYTNNVIYVIEK